MLSAFKVFALHFDVLQSSKCHRAAVCKTPKDAGSLYHCYQTVNLQSVFGALQFSFGLVLWPELGVGSVKILMALTHPLVCLPDFSGTWQSMLHTTWTRIHGNAMLIISNALPQVV